MENGGAAAPRQKRLFEKGDLKYVILDLLKERTAAHGYEIIRALEDQLGGFYAPSAGAIYPTLELLSEKGLIAAKERDGKKIYRLTDPGRAFLEEREDVLVGIRARMQAWCSPEARGELEALRHELSTLAHLFEHRGGSSLNDLTKLHHIRDILCGARIEIQGLLGDEVRR